MHNDAVMVYYRINKYITEGEDIGCDMVIFAVLLTMLLFASCYPPNSIIMYTLYTAQKTQVINMGCIHNYPFAAAQ